MKKTRLKYICSTTNKDLLYQNHDISWQYHSNKWAVVTVESIKKS